MTSHAPLKNRILEQLSGEECDELLREGEVVQFPNRQVVCEFAQPLEHVYFPITSVLSAIIILEDGATIEAAAVGNEGFAAVDLLVNKQTSPYRIIQQIDGTTLRVPTSIFLSVLNRSPMLRDLAERYTLAMLHQAEQNVACNARHSLEERMCRWLLSTADRTERDEFEMTQEFLAEMLGVRRQTVNLTARLLQNAGLVDCQRRRFRIADRDAMEQATCECYRVNRATYDRLLNHAS